MRLTLVSVGKPRDRLANGLVERYLDRLARFGPVECEHVADATSRGRGPAEARALEAGRLRRLLRRRDGRDAVLALDESGEGLDTRGLARVIAEHEQRGTRRLIFLIGGAEGLDPGLVREADRVLSLSPMTLPHELARVVLAEQLYRARTLLTGHPYHRE